MAAESKTPNHEPAQQPRVQEALSNVRPRPWNRLGLWAAGAILIASVALVQPEDYFSSPLFRLGAGPEMAPAPWSKSRRQAPDFVCLLIVGGLRADRAGFGPLPKGELPGLERFAAQATRFESTSAQASHPLVSLKSMLSGSYPANLILEQTGEDQRSLMGMQQPIAFMQDTFSGVQTGLGMWFEQEGYALTAFSDADWVLEDPNFSEGFGSNAQASDSPIEAASAWINALETPSSGKRRALIVHLDDLLRGAPNSNDPARFYASALRSVDQQFEHLMGALEGRGLWEQGLVIVTSDHGTSLGERGLVGCGELYLEQLMVPLGIKFPASWEVPPGCHPGGVELVDLMPTIQDACAGNEAELDGHSILPMTLRNKPGRSWLVSQTSLNEHAANPTTRCAIAPKSWQLIQDARGDGLLFYALGSDPKALQPTQPGILEVPDFVTRLFRNGITE